MGQDGITSDATVASLACVAKWNEIGSRTLPVLVANAMVAAANPPLGKQDAPVSSSCCNYYRECASKVCCWPTADKWPGANLWTAETAKRRKRG